MDVGSALIAMRGVVVPIKQHTRRSLRIEENPDGRKKLSVDENTTCLDPTSTLVALIEKMFGAAG